MKCIILCAGYATRLYPLTRETPKPLLEVGGKPILSYILDKINELPSIDTIYIVTNDKFYAAFEEWKKTAGDRRIIIINDETKTNDDRLGAIGDIHFTVQTQKIDDDVLIIAGDNLFEFSLLHLHRFFTEKKASAVALYDVRQKEIAAHKLGVVMIDTQQKIIDFEEKPALPKTTLISTACYTLTKKDLRTLEHCITENKKPDNLGDFIKYLSLHAHVYGYVFSERWFDIGTHEQLAYAHSVLQKKSADIKTILITGGTGFIGSHLCEHFLAKGHQVICVDNLITGSLENIERFRNNKNFKFIHHDVSRHIVINEPIDFILHFASPASPVDYQKIPIQTLKVGSLGTHNTLGLAVAKKATYFLASTSEVYGDPLVNPQPESYWGNVNPVGPRGCYDEAKRFAEALTMAYHKVHKLDTKIVRIFNTYGPRMRKDDGRVVPNFITQALCGNPLTVYGDGKQTRSFCYVSDLVEGIEKLLFSKINEPVNLGNPHEHTILEFAQRIKEITQSKSKIIFKPLPLDDPHVRCPDITRAKKELGWSPHIMLEDGLKKTVAYFKNAS